MEPWLINALASGGIGVIMGVIWWQERKERIDRTTELIAAYKETLRDSQANREILRDIKRILNVPDEDGK
jgi:uncharacterized protein HemX